MRPLVRSLAAMAMAAALAACGGAPEDEPVTVLAAASLSDAMTEVADAWTAQTGAPVRLSFAASSVLARQIAAGAPGDIFASANTDWMDDLEARGLIDAGSRAAPIGNALVLIAPADAGAAPTEIGPGLDLPALLGPGGRLAVGDPDHVPAGIYARQALETLGLWAGAEPRLARAADVRAALALVARGDAPLGIVYATDAAISDDVAALDAFPPGSHDAIVYPFALLGDAPAENARAFLAFATGPEGLAIFESHGFRACPC